MNKLINCTIRNARNAWMIYLLLRSYLFDVIEDVEDITKSPRCLLDLRRQADAAHGDRLHVVTDE